MVPTGRRMRHHILHIDSMRSRIVACGSPATDAEWSSYPAPKHATAKTPRSVVGSLSGAYKFPALRRMLIRPHVHMEALSTAENRSLT